MECRSRCSATSSRVRGSGPRVGPAMGNLVMPSQSWITCSAGWSYVSCQESNYRCSLRQRPVATTLAVSQSSCQPAFRSSVRTVMKQGMHLFIPPAVRSWCRMGAATNAATVAERAAALDTVEGHVSAPPLHDQRSEVRGRCVMSLLFRLRRIPKHGNRPANTNASDG